MLSIFILKIVIFINPDQLSYTTNKNDKLL